ncbi:mitogen-activated protein kinase 1/3 [Fistulifera solaris]|uniref:Mitogen-activated protein kinase n=1 Tax=Fistulifera solaris TaxID=1519565 RepID=A0A1Z5J9X5_FISSO|nr:mitogen-activated protein kinase 1/3 [Fistulifera solaris]|eukprot:GAX10790.1 mitogen-activated protein kinase 1/3 [Fistulifera solaris]
MNKKFGLNKKLPDEFDHDHHTLATATTTSATISYSTDQGDDASEVGMEVIMSRGGSGEGLEPTVTSTSGEPYRSHSFPAGKHTFTVDERYTMIRTIGSGAYGVVISAKDSKTDKNCAIKMVPKAFSDEIDAKRILREIKLLKHMRHENIVQLVDMMPPNVQYLEDFRDVYLVTDLMETDLHRIIYSKQKLSIDHVQYFVYQVLRGLKYIHSCRVIHRDLKPSNLLVNSNCDLKICDFGLARGLHDEDDGDRASTMFLTEYVVTRWYRAPEIMLACHEYSYPVDVWSVGCIFAELILRKPYFPGDDYIDQLTIICEKLGKLDESSLDFVTSEKAKRFMKKLPDKAPQPFSSQFSAAPPDALNIMRKMLEIHPQKRVSVAESLEHPFFSSLHNADEEVVSKLPFDFSFENEKLHRLRLQELIWKEAADFRPSCLPVAPARGVIAIDATGSRSEP